MVLAYTETAIIEAIECDRCFPATVREEYITGIFIEWLHWGDYTLRYGEQGNLENLRR